jgi:hypothetical protein
LGSAVSFADSAEDSSRTFAPVTMTRVPHVHDSIDSAKATPTDEIPHKVRAKTQAETRI